MPSEMPTIDVSVVTVAIAPFEPSGLWLAGGLSPPAAAPEVSSGWGAAVA